MSVSYRAENLATRERVDLLEEELLEAEAELERRAEQLEATELRITEQIRLQRADDTQKTRAVAVSAAPKASIRTVAATALTTGLVLGAAIAVAVMTAAARTPEPSVAHAAWANIAQPDVGAGRLTLTCKPACDSIILGGRAVGPSPLFNEPVAAGVHRVRLKNHGRTKTVVVAIESGQLSTLSVGMR
jgi:hypothetical protein